MKAFLTLKYIIGAIRDQILLSYRNRRKPLFAAMTTFLPTLQFYMCLHWIMMEMVGLHVFSMLDTNILVLDHWDCSKTAFRLQKMLCHAEQ